MIIINKTKILWVLAGAMILIAGVFFLLSTKASSPLEKDILARSHKYIETLEGQPAGTLSSEEKLLLLNAYYNLKKYRALAAFAEGMDAELAALPPERKQPFSRMINEAKLALRRK